MELITDVFDVLMASCMEGHDGTWDPTGEGRDGFLAMYDLLHGLKETVVAELSKKIA